MVQSKVVTNNNRLFCLFTNILGIVGVVANLCYVDDLKESELIGRIVGAKMGAIVFKNQEVIFFRLFFPRLLYFFRLLTSTIKNTKMERN